MTQNAQKFVTPITFQALSGHSVRSSLWDEAAEAAMGHIELARWATRIVIAPASANSIAQLAHGLANDLLSTLCLATAAPITLVPAMNRLMWANAATQANIALLQSRGIEILGPAEGDQACGEVGAGRMLDPMQIVEALAAFNVPSGLTGKKILISAGPTFEDLDPVRYLGNRSSGKMGFALAAEAAAMGAQVTLIAGPVNLPTPQGIVARIDVRRATQMHNAVLATLPGQDVYIGAAAVADYMPAQTSPQKIKKSSEALSIQLVPAPDIIAEVAMHPHRPKLVVGFAAETGRLEEYAQEKLRLKRLNLIAANDVSQGSIGFESDENALTVISEDSRIEIPRGSKRQVARALLLLIAERSELNV